MIGPLNGPFPFSWSDLHICHQQRYLGRSPSLYQFTTDRSSSGPHDANKKYQSHRGEKTLSALYAVAARVSYLGPSAMTRFGRCCKGSAGIHRNSRVRLNGMQDGPIDRGQGTPHIESISAASNKFFSCLHPTM